MRGQSIEHPAGSGARRRSRAVRGRTTPWLPYRQVARERPGVSCPPPQHAVTPGGARGGRRPGPGRCPGGGGGRVALSYSLRGADGVEPGRRPRAPRHHRGQRARPGHRHRGPPGRAPGGRADHRCPRVGDRRHVPARARSGRSGHRPVRGRALTVPRPGRRRCPRISRPGIASSPGCRSPWWSWRRPSAAGRSSRRAWPGISGARSWPSRGGPPHGRAGEHIG